MAAEWLILGGVAALAVVLIALMALSPPALRPRPTGRRRSHGGPGDRAYTAGGDGEPGGAEGGNGI